MLVAMPATCNRRLVTVELHVLIQLLEIGPPRKTNSTPIVRIIVAFLIVVAVDAVVWVLFARSVASVVVWE